MSTPPILLFDLGGVLVEVTGQRALAQLLPHLDAEAIHARWVASDAVMQFECGRIGPDAFAKAFVAEWNLTLAPADFLAGFTAWVTGFYPGAQALIAQLRQRHTVACLSNTNAAHWARLGEAASLFDRCLTSHTLGCMKPDPQIYAQAVRALGVPASRILFFDDLPANVDAARACGMRAWQVRGLDGTLAALREAGVACDGAKSDPVGP